MKHFSHYLITFWTSWRWHLHYLEADEERQHLVEALDARRPPRFWEGDEAIPMQLVGSRRLADDFPEVFNPGNETFVRIVEPDGSEWKHILEWRAAGGLDKPIAGPPWTNTHAYRIVSPMLRAAISRFALPPHRFYPVEVTHEVTGEQREYFMFHLLGDLHTEKEAAYWKAMPFKISVDKTKETIAQFPQGSVESYQEYLETFRKTYKELGYAPMETSPTFPYFVYREPYDLVWGDGWMALSEEMGWALLAEFGEEYIGEFVGKPTISGFDPEHDTLPAEFLGM